MTTLYHSSYQYGGVRMEMVVEPEARRKVHNGNIVRSPAAIISTPATHSPTSYAGRSLSWASFLSFSFFFSFFFFTQTELSSFPLSLQAWEERQCERGTHTHPHTHTHTITITPLYHLHTAVTLRAGSNWAQARHKVSLNAAVTRIRINLLQCAPIPAAAATFIS